MKKLLTLLTAALLAATMTACVPLAAAPEATVEPEAPPTVAETAEPDPTEPDPTPTATPEPTAMPDMSVESAGITDGAMGLAYGAKGEQFVNSRVPSRSLPLTVHYVPEGTAALALTMIDPDGGDWVHWLACNIPADGVTVEIPENAGIELAASMVQGKNDFGPIGYGGPTPPSGVHTYVITVYALSEALALESGFRLADLTAAMEGRVLAEAALTGTYAH